MNTILEINSKWWWRLTKVICFFLSMFILWISAAIIYDGTETYSPENLTEIEEEYKNKNDFVTNHDNLISELLGDTEIDVEELAQISHKLGFGKKIGGVMLLAIKGELPDLEINGGVVGFYCYSSSKINCDLEFEINKDYYEKIKSNEYVGVLKWMVDEYIDAYNNANSYVKAYNEYERGGDVKDLFHFVNRHTDSYYIRDYRGVVEWRKIVGLTLLSLMIILIIIFLIRGILFYIILGNFSPKK